MLVYYLALFILWPTPGYMMRPSSSTAHSNEEIDHTHFLVSNIGNTYLSDSFWDVQLVVDGEPLHAHRIILALSSGHFRDFFYGGEKKPNKLDVILSEAQVTIFKLLLRYIYTGQIPSSVLKGSDAFKFFEMANNFRISYLQSERLSSSEVVGKEQIDHTHFMVSEISKLYLSNSYSDVVLVVVGERLYAHRVVLASSSKYFEVLLYGGHKESYNDDAEINDVPVPLFKILLKYIYTGRIHLGDFEGREIFELLKMSDFFGISNLKLSLHKYLQRSIELIDVCSFLTLTKIYQFKELELESLKLIDINALEVLHTNDFQNLSLGALQEILIRDTFYAKELDIFNAVCRWIHKNQNDLDSYTKIKVLSAVRYSLMSDEELSEALESHLVSSGIILDAIQLRSIWPSDKPQFRGQLKPNEYLEYQSHRSPIDNVNLIHQSQGFSVSNNTECTNMIKLKYPTWINYIEITLRDEHGINHVKSYSYYIEVSPNGLNWMRVIDYSNYSCRSIQRLYFHPQIAQYIHIVGANSTADATFKVWDVVYNTKDLHKFEIINEIVVPKDESMAALIFYEAIVIEGENSRENFSLFSYYFEGYRDNIYTYHKLGSGFIVVHLRQPYILSSLRMLLWGGNNQSYSYTVEVSLNNLNWNKVVDKSNEQARSWQVLQFIPTPTLYIRITGVKSTAANEFRCVYLEAPPQVPLDSNVVQDDRAEKKETDKTMIASSSENPVV